jgi:6-phosphogluconolactonase
MVTFREFKRTRELEDAATALLAEAFRGATTEPFGVVLTGGRTPLALYARLRQNPPPVARQLHLLLSDERHVPPGDPALNYAHLAPLAAALGVPDAHSLRVNTRLTLEDAARQYSEDVTQFLKQGHITLGILGLGADGHLASLFSDADVRRAQGCVALAVRRPEPPHRVSLAPAVLARAQRLIFLVTGPDKADIVAQWRRQPATVLAGRVTNGWSGVECWYCVREDGGGL